MKRFLTLISLSASLLSSEIYSQVYYQDLVPDTTLNTWSGKDIHIHSVWTSVLTYGAAENLTIWQEFDSQIVINAFDDCEVVMNGLHPAVMNLDDLIGPSLTWQAPDYEILNNGTEGHWVGVTDKYLGVRIQSGADWIYGWIRLDVNTAGTSVTIKDYACNETVNTPLNAGQSVAELDETTAGQDQSVTVFPNPFHSFTTLKFDRHLEDGVLTIYNTARKLLRSVPDISGFQVKIEKENLNSGLYFYELKEESGASYTGKLVVSEE